MEQKIQEKSDIDNGGIGLIYGISDKPKLSLQILLGLQHIFAAFGGIIVVPLVISSSLGFDAKTSTALMSATILAAGIATFIQAKGIGPVGSRVACIMGTDFTFVSPAISVGSIAGLPGILGATILGAFIEIILSFFIKPLMKLFPPLVTGTVVCLIGLTLIPVSIDWAAGGNGAADYGSMLNISIALFVMIFTLLLNHYAKGLTSTASILIGMVFGYIICIPIGMVDFSVVKEANWVSIPKIFEYGIDFNLKYLIPFIPAYLVTTIETVGCLKAICQVSGIKDNDEIIGRGVLSDGIGSMIAGAVGGLVAMFYMWIKYGKPDPSMTANGALAGLVAITAPCAFVNGPCAFFIGGVAGYLVCISVAFVENKLKLDDPVGAISVHCVNGVWGIIALGLFADGAYGDGINGVAGGVRGLFYGDPSQLVAQLIAVAVLVIWGFGVSYIFLKVLDKVWGLRVKPEEELAGLDIPEMGVSAYPDIQLIKSPELDYYSADNIEIKQIKTFKEKV